MAVLVLDRCGSPVVPCTEKQARLLLKCGRACVYCVLPFMIGSTARAADSWAGSRSRCQTGGMMRATVTSGERAGSYMSRVAVRTSGEFTFQIGQDVVQGISFQYCTLEQCADELGYLFNMDSTISAGGGHASRAALSLFGVNAGVSRATV